MAVATSTVGYLEWARTLAAFEREAAQMQRVVAQRIDQHDAHMTGLSALVMAADPPPLESLRAVAANIVQFYPRIAAIDIIGIKQEATSIFTSRAGAAAIPVAEISSAAQRSNVGVDIVPLASSLYLVVKRVPNAMPRFALSLEIDAAKLLDGSGAGPFQAVLMAPSGHAIHRTPSWRDIVEPGHLRLERKMPLNSQSQPLALWLRRDVPLLAMLPWIPLALIASASAVGLWLTHGVVQARRAETEARALAFASAQEARLAHAARINSMGELSLGIAHELTQPLAALLSQSQAGQRMIKTDSPDLAAIDRVLEANARHAKRAGDLLAKLRDWVSLEPIASDATNIDQTIAELIALNARDFEQRGLVVTFVGANRAGMVKAERVCIEQIAQNLIINARDACLYAEPPGRSVMIETFANGEKAGFRVVDDGPGIAPEVAKRLFEPFATTKIDGMGLGLSISRRLAERFGGAITGDARNDGKRGAVFTVTLPLAEFVEAG